MNEPSDNQARSSLPLSSSRENEQGDREVPSSTSPDTQEQLKQESQHLRTPPDLIPFSKIIAGFVMFAFGVAVLDGIILLCALAILVQEGSSPFQQPFLLPTNQHAVVVTIRLGALGVLSFGGFLLFWLVDLWSNRPEAARRRALRTGEQWTLMPITPLLAVVSCLLSIASLVGAAHVATEADMTRTGFVQQELTITAPGTVIFVNPANGVSQLLCLGSDDECALRPKHVGDPPLLAHGLRLLPGQSVSVAFDAPGDYQVISATTAAMSITIHVQRDSGG